MPTALKLEFCCPCNGHQGTFSAHVPLNKSVQGMEVLTLDVGIAVAAELANVKHVGRECVYMKKVLQIQAARQVCVDRCCVPAFCWGTPRWLNYDIKFFAT